MSRICGFVRIIRPVNALMMGISIVIGALIAGGSRGDTLSVDLLLGFVTGFTLAGAAMTINDYYDKDIDTINEPERPIPSGQVKPREAVAFSLLLSSIGLVSAWLLGLRALAIAVFAWVIMMVYSSWGKRKGFIGNIMVSINIALPFIYGGVVTSGSGPTFVYSLIAFLANTGREITKGIVDLEGDRAEGVKTIAVQRGPRTASIAAALLYVAAGVISLIPLVFGLVSVWYAPFVALADIGLLYESLSILRDPSRQNSRRIKGRLLYWMLFGLLAFAAGSLL